MRGSNAADLAADIEERVAVGTLRPGDRLPPVRSLATELGLAPNTVAAAYRRLGERGIVIGRGRSGTFIASRPPVAMPVTTTVPAGMMDLSTGNPALDLLPSLEEAMRTVAGPSVLYRDAPVDERLRDVGSAWLAGDGVSVEHLTVVNGALDGIERVLGAHVRPGDRIAVEDPAYSSVIDLLGSMSLVPVPVAVDDDGPITADLGRALDRGVQAVVITPRAQNPFGSALTKERAGELRALLDAAPDVLVVEDDHASAVAGAPLFTVAGGRERWATVRSAAKAYGPDLRLAVLAGDGTTVRRIEGRLQLGPGWVSHILQRLAVQLIADPAVDALVAAAADAYRVRRMAVVDELRTVGVGAHASSGLNVWIPVDDEAAAVAGLRDRGIAVRAGSRYRIRSGPGIRVTVAALTDADRPGVLEALTRVLSPKTVTRAG
jgi:DNA-binding transcriptional MocR family regulator